MHGNYIKGPEKFPLEFSRWGYLPIPIQKFFDERLYKHDNSVIYEV